MARTWKHGLMIWLLVVLVVDGIAVASMAIFVEGLTPFLNAPPMILATYVNVYGLTGGGLEFRYYEAVDLIVRLLYWPVFLLPVLAWLKTGRRRWLAVGAIILALHVTCVVHFLLTFEMPAQH